MDLNKIMILVLTLLGFLIITILITNIIIRKVTIKDYNSITKDMNIKSIKEILGKPQEYYQEQEYEVYTWYMYWGLYGRKSYTIVVHVNNNTDSIIICGTTGEASSMTVKEHIKSLNERRQGLGYVSGHKIYRNISSGNVFENIKQLVMAEILRNYPDCGMIYVGADKTVRIESCTVEDTEVDNTLYILADKELVEVGLLNAENGVVDMDNSMIFFDYTELEEPDQGRANNGNSL